MSKEQRLQLRHWLELIQKLRHPEFKEAVPGFEGIKAGDEILKERQAVGVLIGGLAEAIWNQSRKTEDLAKHKDVDILVTSNDFRLTELFEGGIDWWLPRSEVIETEAAVRGPRQKEVTWWENGNSAALLFRVHQRQELEPGLYFPNRQWISDMREIELKASIGQEADSDYEVLEAFRQSIESRLGKKVMPVIAKEFGARILDDDYGISWEKSMALELDSFGPDVLEVIDTWSKRLRP